MKKQSPAVDDGGTTVIKFDRIINWSVGNQPAASIIVPGALVPKVENRITSEGLFVPSMSFFCGVQYFFVSIRIHAECIQ